MPGTRKHSEIKDADEPLKSEVVGMRLFIVLKHFRSSLQKLDEEGCGHILHRVARFRLETGITGHGI